MTCNELRGKPFNANPYWEVIVANARLLLGKDVSHLGTRYPEYFVKDGDIGDMDLNKLFSWWSVKGPWSLLHSALEEVHPGYTLSSLAAEGVIDSENNYVFVF